MKDYVLIKKLGEGGFGKVFLVRLKSDENKYFAMKVLKKTDLICVLTQKERDAWVKAKSPFISNIKQAFQEEAYLYLISEYAPGKDLN